MTKSKSEKKKQTGFSKKVLIHTILDIFTENPTRTFNYKQLAKLLEVKDDGTEEHRTGCGCVVVVLMVLFFLLLLFLRGH